jgi:branched-chain amino acid transport system ATP-binding protein
VSEPLLEVEGLEVVYGHAIRAIQGISFRVGEGEVVGLVGLNGAGKTTAVRAVSGFLSTEHVRVTDGRIRFAGRSILGLRPYHTARLGIAVVPEREKVFDTLTVRENLELAATAGRHSVAETLALFPALAERTEQQAVFLSGGERQMLAIGSALLSAPRLLIVDEASLGLAPPVCRQVFDILARLNRERGMSVLIVDQNVAAVFSLANFGYILENGRVVFDGPCERLLQHADVQEFYLGKGKGRDRGYRDVKQYRRVRRWH